MDNSPDRSTGHGIGLHQGLNGDAGNKLGANRSDLRFRQLGVSRPASFPSRVHDVVVCGSSKQMGGIAAERVVAGMANIQARGERSLGQLVSKTMRLDSGMTGGIETAISTRSSARFPGPAFVRPAPVNLFPETFDGISPYWHKSPVQKGDPRSLAVLVEGTRCGALGVIYEKSADHIGPLDNQSITHDREGVK